MIDLIVGKNRYAQQAWLHLEAGDPSTAAQWARRGREARKVSPCVLLLAALALCCSGDTATGAREISAAAGDFERSHDWLGAGVTLVCLALVSDARRFQLLERADVHLERAQRCLAQAGDADRWRSVKALRGRVADDTESLLPHHILQIEYAA